MTVRAAIDGDPFCNALLACGKHLLSRPQGLCLEDREDALQNAALALCRYVFVSEDQAREFLYVVYSRKITDILRARGGRSPDGIYHRPELAVAEHEEMDITEIVVLRERLRRAVNGLPLAHREGLRDPDCHPETLRKRRSRAVAALRLIP